ncbi:MAG: hypothetical protein RL488_148 [Actinomycetota bacterium]
MNKKTAFASAILGAVLVSSIALNPAVATNYPAPAPTPSPTNTYTLPYGTYDSTEDCSGYDINAHRVVTFGGDKFHRVFNEQPSPCWMRYYLHVGMFKAFYVDVLPNARKAATKDEIDAIDRKVSDVVTTLKTLEITGYGFDWYTHKEDLELKSAPTPALVAKIRGYFANTPAANLVSLPGDADYRIDLKATDQILVNDGEPALYVNQLPYNLQGSSVALKSTLVQLGKKPAAKPVVKKPVVKKLVKKPVVKKPQVKKPKH